MSRRIGGSLDPSVSRFWEDVEEGDELVPLSKIATTQTLVRFAGASGDFSPHHFDSQLADRWFPGTGIIVHGALKCAWLGHLLTEWVGAEGQLRRLSTEDRGMDVPRHMRTQTEPEEGETWYCGGRVVRKYRDAGKALVDLEVWVEDSRGRTTICGEATVILPLRIAGK